MGNAFHLEERDDKIAVLTFDLTEKKVNTLGRAVLQELGGIVRTLAGRPDLKGLLFRSGKPGQFIAGADLNELAGLAFATKDAVGEAVGFGHALFGAISDLPFPTVALVDGNCMGGGTELILAMDERILSASSQTKIALPEVKIGLLPAWGGTQRLPRLIGVPNAVEVITSGEPVAAEKAVALGLAFDAVAADRLIDEGVRRIVYLRESAEWTRNREQRRGPIALSDDESRFLFGVAEGAILAKTKGQYPAPLVALKAIRDGVKLPLDEALKVERAAGLELVGSATSANLIGVFFLQNKLGRDPGIGDPTVKPRPIRRVGVLGAGLMGSGIATAHARSNIPAVMVDVDESRIADGLAKAQEVVLSRIKIGRAAPMDLARMLANLNTSTSLQGFADCDLVIEAVTEDEALKTAMFREIGGIVSENAILASNTSTISITRMAEAVPNPARFLGMHFFSPVDRMELVEVVRGKETSDEAVSTVVALARAIRKTPIVVKDCAGFLVNRVLFPYMNEALLLLQEGASMDAIDLAASKFGMPVGPIALEDMVGLDTAAYAGRVMARAYPDRSVSSPILMDLVKLGRLGKKAGLGFRKYSGKSGKPEADPAADAIIKSHRSGDRTPSEAEISDRLFLPMLLEATRVLEEGIVREPGDVDMGLILGIGFPPFRGGLLRWADSQGIGRIADRLGNYRHLGKRFESTSLVDSMARSNETFYPRPKTMVA